MIALFAVVVMLTFPVPFPLGVAVVTPATVVVKTTSDGETRSPNEYSVFLQELIVIPVIKKTRISDFILFIMILIFKIN